MNATRFRDTSWFVSGLLKVMAIGIGVALVVNFYRYFHGEPSVTNTSVSNLTSGFRLFGIGSQSSLTKIDPETVELASLLTKAVAGCCFMKVLWDSSRLFADFSNGETPFSERQIKRLSRIGKIVLAVGLFQSLFFSLMVNLFAQKLIFFSFSLGSIFVLGLVLYCVSGMFNYGLELQKISEDIV